MFGTIVWATDGSELADETLPLVTELAASHGSRVIAVHVHELSHDRGFGGGPLFVEDELQPKDEEEIQEKIARQVDDMRAAGFDVELVIVTSRRHDIADLIAEAALTADADLIVIGTHGRTAAAAVILGSVTTALTHVAPCPVVAVPPLSQRRLGPRDTQEPVGVS